ncbi:hypothetical protein OEZ85_010155 [Tetradesmus obliquus]|uniref:Uncharacterized protein n=2 Tax=Tetradesmus obliquus TaxID=3088 RepID=A0A383V550_TETOB|nr:hypothetical protein OEZ85_010155 [Tetradesmus obliquus]|eukprot:jgi/Sobl393_1/7738/SZX59506.1
MSRGGVLSKAWDRLRSLVLKETLVGADANGNKYYKFLEKDLQGQLVERRRVRVPGNDLLYDPKTVPAEWRSWLARTRSEPPTEEEMARAAARQVLMQQRVAAIEEREQQRRIRMESLGQQATTAGGPDVSRFTSQLENRGYAAADSSKAGGQAGAAGGASGGAGGQGAAGSGSSTGQGS